ncbi:cystatin domain-containing protein [Acinetobacter baumannii]
MALKSFLFALLFISILYDASAALGARTGGYQPIKSLNSAQVVEIAKFAVKEHNSQSKSALVYVAVVNGQYQVVAGTNYKLVISAKDGVKENKYEAVVWDKPWMKFRELTSFEEIN